MPKLITPVIVNTRSSVFGVYTGYIEASPIVKPRSSNRSVTLLATNKVVSKAVRLSTPCS